MTNPAITALSPRVIAARTPEGGKIAFMSNAVTALTEIVIPDSAERGPRVLVSLAGGTEVVVAGTVVDVASVVWPRITLPDSDERPAPQGG